MASEAIKAAIAELRGKLVEKDLEVTDLKRAINLLLSTIGETPQFADVQQDQTRRGLQLKPDQFFRKSITTAAQEYLKAKGEAATVPEIIEALKNGGCDLGASPLRNVKISLSKNSGTFAQVSDDVFGLWDFYGGSPRARKADEVQPDILNQSEDVISKMEGA